MISFKRQDPITYDLTTKQFSGDPSEVAKFQNKTSTPAVPSYQTEILQAKDKGHKPERIKKAIDQSNIEDKPGAHAFLGTLFQSVGDFLGDSTEKAGKLVEDIGKKVVPPKEIAVTPEKEPTPDRLIEAVAYNETGVIPEGKKYSFSQPSGNEKLGKALGKYQVTEGELKTYAPRYLGEATTTQEFLSNPELQDQYMQGKIDYLRKQGYSDEEILAIHRGGINAPKDKYKPYVDKGMKYLSALGK